MKRIIVNTDTEHKIFYVLYSGRKVGFYLSNRLSKTFFSYLKKGVMVDFEVAPKLKKINNISYYQVAFFNQIISLQPYRVHYDLFKLRKEMQAVLEANTYYLFIDFEMTMPGYHDPDFRPEIIQVGFVLSEAKQEPILSDGYYVLPKEKRILSKRTKRFLNLEEDVFFQKAIPFDTFYEQLQSLIETYHPKLVVWGKNDLSALNDAYLIHQKKVLTHDMDFIDLLKLHKDYYNLKDDLGLFKAYKTYYAIDFDQTHDAKDDAIVTKLVFDAFLNYM